MSTKGGGGIRRRTFGQALRSFRQRQGLSVDKLAHLAGLPRTAVSRLEAGDQSPGPQTVDLLGSALQLSDDELATFRSLAEASAAPSADVASDPAPAAETPDGDARTRAASAPTSKRIAFDAAIAAAVIALFWATFEISQGVRAVGLCLVGLAALGCIAVANHASGMVQRVAIGAFVFLLPIALVALYIATNSEASSGGPDAPTTASSSGSVPETKTPARTSPSMPSAWTPPPVEKPTSHEVVVGGSVTLFAGGLIIGVGDVDTTRAALILSTSGPECTAQAGLAEKVIVADPERNHWYEIRVTSLDYPKVVVAVARGTGTRETENCY